MIFCRIEHEDFEMVFGEGLNIDDAFTNAKSVAAFDIGPECNITFWDAKKINTKVEFSYKVIVY